MERVLQNLSNFQLFDSTRSTDKPFNSGSSVSGETSSSASASPKSWLKNFNV